jgi:hypothetical protein
LLKGGGCGHNHAFTLGPQVEIIPFGLPYYGEFAVVFRTTSLCGEKICLFFILKKENDSLICLEKGFEMEHEPLE